MSRALVVVLALSAAGACVSESALSARRDTVERIAQRARESGARSCAPEELALSDANMRFFALETRAGDDTRAAEHLTLAELNARAALILSAIGCMRGPAESGTLSDAPRKRNRKQVHASPASITTLARQRDPGVLDASAGSVPPRPTT